MRTQILTCWTMPWDLPENKYDNSPSTIRIVIQNPDATSDNKAFRFLLAGVQPITPLLKFHWENPIVSFANFSLVQLYLPGLICQTLGVKDV